MNLIDALHFKCNNIHCEEENDRGKERQKPFGPGFLDIGNFNIGRS